eukprot:tig00021135_g18932.t1
MRRLHLSRTESLPAEPPEWGAGLPRISHRSHGDSPAAPASLGPINQHVLPYVPYRTLASALPQLAELREGSKVTLCSMQGAGLLVDVAGFSSLARSFTRSDAASASEELCGTLNEYMHRLVECLHARGADILQYLGDAVVAFIPVSAGRSKRAAGAAAVDAARAIRAISFQRDQHKLTAHTGVGVGELVVYLLRGCERSSQAIFAGDLVVQVCEAQRASWGEEIIVTEEARALLELEEGPDVRRLPAHPGEAPARPLHRLLQPPPSKPSRKASVAPADLPAVAPPPAGASCGCGAPLPEGSREAAAALRPYADELMCLVPAMAAEGGANSFWAHDIRTVYCVFASFPEARPCRRRGSLDAAHLEEAGGGGGGEGRAERVGLVVRSLHGVAEDYGGSVNKVMIDEKGASAIIGFGLPGGYAHEDDAERATRAALALQSWFAETDAPFACGVVGGRTFCGSLGAPCRKGAPPPPPPPAPLPAAAVADLEGLSPQSTPLSATASSSPVPPPPRSLRPRLAGPGRAAGAAARLMGAARAAINGGGVSDSGRARQQEVLCDASIVTAVAARGRWPGFALDPLPPVPVKGFSDPVPVFRPRLAPDGPPPAPAPLLDSEAAAGGPNEGEAESEEGRDPVPCLGREGELARATGAVEALVAHGRGATVVVEGDAGYGKTRLVEELARVCALRRVRVLRCAGGALEETTALWALRGVLASLADVSSPEAMRADLVPRALLTESDCSMLWTCFFDSETLEGKGSTSTGSEVEGDLALRRSYRNRAGGADPDPLLAYSKRSRRRSNALGTGMEIIVLRVATVLSRLVAALERDGGDPEGPPSRPLALFLEDAQWVDSASWIVARCLRDLCPRLLLVITTRPLADPPRDFLLLSGQLVDEAGQILSDKAPPAPSPPRPLLPLRAPAQARDSPPASLLAQQARGGAAGSSPGAARPAEVVFLRLGPLAREAALALLTNLSARMGVVWPAAAEAAVLEKAGGVPLFLVELCRQLRQTGPETVMALLRSGSFAVPDTIQQIILSRADRLSAAAQAVLKLAAVVGSDFSCEAVCAIDPTGEGGMGPANVWQAVLELRMAGLVAERDAEPRIDAFGWGGPGPNRPFNFLHNLMRDTIYGAIPGANRREIHGRLARWLEARSKERRDPLDPAVLALHWRAADQTARGLAYLDRAARQALRANAFVEARRMFADLCVSIDEARPAPRPATALRSPGAPRRLGSPARGDALPKSLRATAPAGQARPLPLAAPPRALAPAHRARRAGGAARLRRSQRAQRRPPRPAPPRPASPQRRRRLTWGAQPAYYTEADEDEWARWAMIRASALRSWAMIEYRMGRLTLSADLALNCLESLGERLPRDASLLRNLGTLGRLARLALRQLGAPVPRRGVPRWLLLPESQEARTAILDCLVIVVWVGVKGALRGAGAAYGTVLAGLVRAMELSSATPFELLALPDVRVRSNYCSALEMLGMRSLAKSVERQVEELADQLDDDAVRMVVTGNAALRLCTAGRFKDGLQQLRACIGYGGDQLASDPQVFLAIGLALAVRSLRSRPPRARAAGLRRGPGAGDLAGAAVACEDALAGFSRFGMEEMSMVLVSVVDGWCSLLARHDDHAALLVRRAEQSAAGGSESLRAAGWYLETIRCIGAAAPARVARLRRGADAGGGRGGAGAAAGDLEGAREAVARAAAFWRAQAKTVIWTSLPAIAVVLDFALWRPRPGERGGPAKAAGPRPESSATQSGEAASRRQSAAASSSGAPRRPSVLNPGNVPVSVPGTAAATRRPSAAVHPYVEALPVEDEGEEGGREGPSPEVREAAERAEAFAGEVLELLEATARRRLPALRPFCDLARAQRPGTPPERRLALLRAALAGFGESALQPLEALAYLHLAQALQPGDPAGAAEALDAAARIASDTGLRIPASDAPLRPAGYISLFV